MSILVINSHDYSRYIARNGYSWTRNDLDGSGTTRTKDGKMRRQKISEKRTLSYTFIPMPRELLSQLDTDLSSPTFSATYLDLHGERTSEFYCSSFPSNLVELQDNQYELWSGATCTLIEV